jgi:hypothetical protein
VFDDKYVFSDGQFYPIMGKTIVRCFEVESSQVPDMFLKEFPIAPHIYPICFGKCCPHFTYIGGPKRRNLAFVNRSFFLFQAMGHSNWLIANPKKKKN